VARGTFTFSAGDYTPVSRDPRLLSFWVRIDEQFASGDTPQAPCFKTIQILRIRFVKRESHSGIARGSTEPWGYEVLGSTLFKLHAITPSVAADLDSANQISGVGDGGSIGFRMGAQPIGNSTGVALETVERHLPILADLDEVAVGITHGATPFPAVIVHRLGKKERSFVPIVCNRPRAWRRAS
jgi:hypothetical protein